MSLDLGCHMKELNVDKECLLFDFLREKISGSKNNIKSLLSKEMISVNDKVVTKYNYLLKVTDRVKIGARKIDSHFGNIKIIYEDKDFLVVDKPNGILTISTENEKDNKNNLFDILNSYMKKRNSNSRLYVVHRLDKDTSGVILFSKNEHLKDVLQDNWNSCAIRKYYAIVYGIPKKQEILKSYLKEDNNLMTYSASKEDGKLAITSYERIKNNKDYSLLYIDIKTGRRNQIRVQLKDNGFPIVGDSKYGKKDKLHKRLMLHATKLIITNPINKKVYEFDSSLDKTFLELVK